MMAVLSLEVRFLMTGMKMEDFWCSEGRVGSRKYVFSHFFCDSCDPLMAGRIPGLDRILIAYTVVSKYCPTL